MKFYRSSDLAFTSALIKSQIRAINHHFPEIFLDLYFCEVQSVIQHKSRNYQFTTLLTALCIYSESNELAQKSIDATKNRKKNFGKKFGEKKIEKKCRHETRRREDP